MPALDPLFWCTRAVNAVVFPVKDDHSGWDSLFLQAMEHSGAVNQRTAVISIGLDEQCGGIDA